MSQELGQFNPKIGQLDRLDNLIARIVAPNPSPMTFRGTNTYIFGPKSGDIAIIDPGPESDAHLNAILSSVDRDQKVTHILVTHSHVDHSPLAARLSRETNAPIYAFGPSDAGRSRAMQTLIASGYAGGGEGIDHRFQPDHKVQDGDTLTIGDYTLDVIHTPGHMGNHVCFAYNDSLFSGDHVMGWASSMVSPPEGDLTDFMASCQKLSSKNWAAFYPGHGDTIRTPNTRIDWLIAHRNSREQDILKALTKGAQTPRQLAEIIYTDTPKSLLEAATRNVFAHLIDLTGKNQVCSAGAASPESKFSIKINM